MFGWARRERAQTHNAKLNYIVLPASQQRGIPCCYRTWHTIPQWRNRQWSWHLAKVAHLYPWNTRCMLKGWNGKVITSTFFTLFRRISFKSLVLVVFLKWNYLLEFVMNMDCFWEVPGGEDAFNVHWVSWETTNGDPVKSSLNVPMGIHWGETVKWSPAVA